MAKNEANKALTKHMEEQEKERKAENKRREEKEERQNASIKRKISIAGGFFVVLVALILLSSFLPRIDAGHRGVMVRFGDVQERILDEGIHLALPIIHQTGVIQMNVQTRLLTAETTSASKDLQDVSTTVALNYHLEATMVNDIYQTLGMAYEASYVSPAIQEVVKSSTAKFSATELITERSKVKKAIELGLEERLNKRGIIVETVSITDFQFSEVFTESIEAKQQAEQDALRAENELRKIEVEARQIEATAIGEANAKIAKANAEAKAIQAIETQLSNSPNYISWVKATSWDGVLPKYMGGGIVPFLDVSGEDN